MSMSDQHCVYLTESILWKPFDRCSLERLSRIDDNRASIKGVNFARNIDVIETQTYTSLPSSVCVLTATDVLRRILYFPAGVEVEVHVLHFGTFGEVKQSIYGRLAEVPVPRNMSSVGAEVSCSIVGRWCVLEEALRVKPFKQTDV